MRENAAMKARRYLSEGRLYIRHVGPDGITALCKGDGEFYRLGLRNGSWHCDCPAVSVNCSHLLGLRLVCTRTGGTA
jgi:hypothetical protein